MRKSFYRVRVLAEARQLYGAALKTSYAQGGSWTAKTPQGTLDGYLTAEVDQNSPFGSRPSARS